ncbi:MAG: SOS response-associated peptidase [Chitinophagaceae bacterium]|nr:SOS response-associated peptidase [Chitinophagaceae bacterium]
MCYDMSFFSNIKKVSDYLPVASTEKIHFDPTYHKVAQSFPPWPVVINDDGLKLKLFEWGLIADYMNSPEKIKEYRNSMANARSEKILGDNRSVWHRLRKQRCIVCSTGFFEHRDTGGKKKLPYFIRDKKDDLFFFAGLYNYSPLPDPETGELTGTFSIITRAANPLMAKIHNNGPNPHRMPLVLPADKALHWLQPGLEDREIAELLAYEFPEQEMEAWPVQTIRTRKADDVAVIAPLDAALFPPL